VRPVISFKTDPARADYHRILDQALDPAPNPAQGTDLVSNRPLELAQVLSPVLVTGPVNFLETDLAQNLDQAIDLVQSLELGTDPVNYPEIDRVLATGLANVPGIDPSISITKKIICRIGPFTATIFATISTIILPTCLPLGVAIGVDTLMHVGI
jgi:hypothetical protein